MSGSIRVFGVCLLLAGLVVAGCGGDDDSTTAGGGGDNGSAAAGGEGSDGGDRGDSSAVEATSESKEEYVAKANALCKKRKLQVQADLLRLFKRLSADGPPDPEANASKIVEEGVAPGLEAEVRELRELGAPEGDEDQVEELLTAIEASFGEAREDPEAFVNDPAAFMDTRRLAREYGIDQCGRPG